MRNLSLPPFTNLVTERLVLRQLRAEDDKEIQVLRSDERILKFLIITKCTSLEEARAFIEKIDNSMKKKESVYWGITQKIEDKLIGTICLWHISEENFRAEIGYVLHPDFQRKGIMTEALDAVLNYGFNILKLHSMEANVDPANIPSIKLLGKKGFVKEAHLKQNIFFNGQFLDSAIYSLLNPFNREDKDGTI